MIDIPSQSPKTLAGQFFDQDNEKFRIWNADTQQDEAHDGLGVLKACTRSCAETGMADYTISDIEKCFKKLSDSGLVITEDWKAVNRQLDAIVDKQTQMATNCWETLIVYTAGSEDDASLQQASDDFLIRLRTGTGATTAHDAATWASLQAIMGIGHDDKGPGDRDFHRQAADAFLAADSTLKALKHIRQLARKIEAAAEKKQAGGFSLGGTPET